jgi:hypothetical protein
MYRPPELPTQCMCLDFLSNRGVRSRYSPPDAAAQGDLDRAKHQLEGFCGLLFDDSDIEFQGSSSLVLRKFPGDGKVPGRKSRLDDGTLAGGLGRPRSERCTGAESERWQ